MAKKSRWKVVITGASSKLAHSLLPLLAGKYELVMLVRDQNKVKLPRGKVIEIDLEQASVEDLRAVVRSCDAVVNLAGLVDFTASKEKLFAVNAAATCKLVKACEAEKVLNFVHCSSISVYGLPSANTTEDASLQPVTDYGKSKLAGERCVTVSKLKWVSLRPGIIYGQNYLTEFQVLKKLMQKNRAAIIGSGENHLPLVFQIDVGKAFALALAALRRGEKKVLHQCFTIVAEPQPTQLECYATVKKVFGFPTPHRRVSPRLASILLKGYGLLSKVLGKSQRNFSYEVLQVLAMDRKFDCSKAAKILKWRAKVGIEAGLNSFKNVLA